jgi:hypothetical protein
MSHVEWNLHASAKTHNEAMTIHRALTSSPRANATKAKQPIPTSATNIHATIDGKDLKTGWGWGMMGEFQKIFYPRNGSMQQMENSC